MPSVQCVSVRVCVCAVCVYVCVCVRVCVCQLFKWGHRLVSSGEAAHPAVTSMGTWCLLGKQISNCPHLA